MQTFPSFRYLYLPWLSGLLIMALMLLTQPTIEQQIPVSTSETQVIPQIKEAPKEVLQPVTTKMPFFPGCNGIDGKEKRNCSNERMYAYIYEHAAYPVGKPSQRSAGIVEIDFLITPNGTVRDPKLLRSPGHRRGEDALRIFQNMEAAGITWEPATRNGQPISARMNITIQYNMVWAGTPPKR